MATIAECDQVFWSQVDKNGPVPETRPELGPCWLWTGNITPKGYGRFSFADIDMMAHVYSYKRAHDLPIQKDTRESLVNNQRDHLCRVRHCVRDSHLEQVTRRENILRGESPPAQNARKEMCEHGHVGKFTTTASGRRCLECWRLAANAEYAERKATGKPFKWGGRIIQGGESPTAINASKTHCIRGHLITGVKKSGKGRYCKECANIASRDRLRRIHGIDPKNYRV